MTLNVEYFKITHFGRFVLFYFIFLQGSIQYITVHSLKSKGVGHSALDNNVHY